MIRLTKYGNFSKYKSVYMFWALFCKSNLTMMVIMLIWTVRCGKTWYGMDLHVFKTIHLTDYVIQRAYSVIYDMGMDRTVSNKFNYNSDYVIQRIYCGNVWYGMNLHNILFVY